MSAQGQRLVIGSRPDLVSAEGAVVALHSSSFAAASEVHLMKEPSPAPDARNTKGSCASFQAELCKLQDWVKHKGLRVIVVFEGRDAAGKGGTIRAITERVSPRVFPRRGIARSVGSREVADVHAALHAAFSGGRRSRDSSIAVGTTAPASSM